MESESHPFAASAFEQRKLFKEKLARSLMLTAALALIVPVISIIIYLFYKASPVLSVIS